MGLFTHTEKYKTPTRQFIELYNNIMNNTSHCLLCGATGSGKSVLLNNCILYTMNNNTPTTTKFIFFDPKRVELSQYKNTRYCLKFCTDIKEINATMQSLINLMNCRYKEMEKRGLKKSEESQIIVIIDELADLLLGYGKESKQFENMLVLLLQKARASNIKFVVATQQPSRQVLKNRITLNLIIRVALHTESTIESKQIINVSGAETLPKYGQCILKTPDLLTPKKYQVALTPDNIQEQIIKSWCKGGSMVIK